MSLTTPTETIPARLFERARCTPDVPAFFTRTDGGWEATSWCEYADLVSTAGRALIAEGIEPGDVVCILGFNRAEWVVLHVAAMAIGAVPTGIYPTSSEGEVAYLLEHTETSFVLLETDQHLERVLAADASAGGRVRCIVSMRGGPTSDDSRSCSWQEFLDRAAGVEESALHARLERLAMEALGTLIYTSGTTGPPKGVMLTHLNLSWTAEAMQRTLEAVPDDRMLSYLPLSHIAEQMFTIHSPITVGYAVYFAESIGTVSRDIKEIRPTILFGVPRIWEKFHAGIFAKLEQATGLKRSLLTWARSTATAETALRKAGRRSGALLAAKSRIAEQLVFSKLRNTLGLDAARIHVSGAAPLSTAVMDDLASVGLVVLEVYGQSESSGPTSFNFPDDYLLGSVGKPLAGVEVSFGSDGEILVRGANVFGGYYKAPDATAETIVDGWLASGDLGRFDERGFLHITGRKKDILITAGGKNVAPQNIEFALQASPLVEAAVLIGDRRKFLSALLTVDEAALADWARSAGIDVASARTCPELQAALDAHLQVVNERLAKVEQVKVFTVLETSFSIDSGELTPTMKIKRQVVERLHGDAIEAMYV